MKTALITGASKGIGLELAKIFGKQKINLILVARDESLLKKHSEELSKNGISVSYYAKDISSLANAEEIYKDITDRGIQIDYLINNAGFGINGEFSVIEWKHELDMLNLNMITLAYFTKVFAAEMKKRGFGKILNVGSTGSFQPGPYMAGYCATKAFVLNLSEAVNEEMKGTGVSVSTLCPGVTETEFHSRAKTNSTLLRKMLGAATAKDVAELGYLIMMKGKSFSVHGLVNKIMIFSNRLSSRKLSTSLAGRLMKG